MLGRRRGWNGLGKGLWTIIDYGLIRYFVKQEWEVCSYKYTDEFGRVKFYAPYLYGCQDGNNPADLYNALLGVPGVLFALAFPLLSRIVRAHLAYLTDILCCRPHKTPLNYTFNWSLICKPPFSAAPP